MVVVKFFFKLIMRVVKFVRVCFEVKVFKEFVFLYDVFMVLYGMDFL